MSAGRGGRGGHGAAGAGVRERRRGAGPLPACSRADGERGLSLAELLVVLTITSFVLALGGTARSAFDRAKLEAVAQHVHRLMLRCRTQAALDGRNVAIVFEQDEGGWSYGVYGDGDGDGVRRRDIASGRDPLLEGPFRFTGRHEGVRLEVLDLPELPAVPPATGRLTSRDAVRFGADMISFSPLGRSTSGTLFLAWGRHDMLAIRVFGATGRVRLWAYSQLSGRWVRA